LVGIGTLWSKVGVTGPQRKNCPYRGKKATAEFQAISGCGVVPTENDGDRDGGTFCGHWDEECMGTELMTGFVDPIAPLSRITVATLEDLGYEVDYTNVDNYTANDLNPNCQCRRRRNLNDMIHGEAYQFDFQISGVRRRQLSDEVYDMAISYGKKMLSGQQQFQSIVVNNSTNYVENPNSDVQFVGDKVIVVFAIENGTIFDVIVRDDD
jgi:hypothetical protein